MNLTTNVNSDIELTENKLILSDNAVKLLNAEYKTRISIRFILEDGNPVPVIGTVDMFGDNDGNQLTKHNTVSYRGEQNKYLRNYGTKFAIRQIGSYFRLINVENGESQISLDIINK